jgi:hypothetical protein
MQAFLRVMRMSGLVVLAAASLLCAAAWMPEQWTAEQKAYHESEEAMVAQTVKKFNTSCGTSVSVTVDWDSMKGTTPDQYSTYTYCAAPIQTLISFCAYSGDNKKMVQNKIKSLKCSYAGEGNRSLRAVDGALIWKFDWASGNDNDFIWDYYHNKLFK